MTMKLRVFTSFSGYASQLMALRDIGADYECVGWSEIDKWAIKAHNAVFPELADRNYGDITKIDWSAVSDSDINKIQAAGISDTQQYKLAGNSIVKAPMMGIFENMLRFNS